MPMSRARRLVEWLLVAAAFAFLAAYAVPIIWPTLSPQWRRVCEHVVLVTWLAFAAEVVVNLLLSTDKWGYIKTHKIQIASVVLPFLRPLRLLRLVALLDMLNRRATASLRGRIATYVAISASMLVVIGALAEVDAERADGGTIVTFGQGLWWAIATMTTVGYGDAVPQSLEGRIVAAALMLGGIGILSSVTGMFASWMVDRFGEEKQATSEVAVEIRELRDEVARLGALLVAQQSGASILSADAETTLAA